MTSTKIKHNETKTKQFFLNVPHLATFISFFIEYVIASIAYIHPVHGGIQTHKHKQNKQKTKTLIKKK
jgi:hypothetical protein